MGYAHNWNKNGIINVWNPVGVEEVPVNGQEAIQLQQQQVQVVAGQDADEEKFIEREVASIGVMINKISSYIYDQVSGKPIDFINNPWLHICWVFLIESMYDGER